MFCYGWIHRVIDLAPAYGETTAGLTRGSKPKLLVAKPTILSVKLSGLAGSRPVRPVSSLHQERKGRMMGGDLWPCRVSAALSPEGRPGPQGHGGVTRPLSWRMPLPPLRERVEEHTHTHTWLEGRGWRNTHTHMCALMLSYTHTLRLVPTTNTHTQSLTHIHYRTYHQYQSHTHTHTQGALPPPPLSPGKISSVSDNSGIIPFNDKG